MRKIKTKILLIVFILANAATLFFFWFIQNAINKLQDETVAIRSEVRNLYNEEIYLLLIKKVLADTIAERKIIDGYFLSSDGVVDFIKQLENIAAKNNLILVMESVGIEETESNYRENFRVIVKTKGDFYGTMKFIDTLENLPYHLTIRLVDLAVSEETKPIWRGVYEIFVLKFK
jgi:hypothetical protein